MRAEQIAEHISKGKKDPLTPLDDLLKGCQKPGRALGAARLLAPVLLGHPFAGETDDGALIESLQALLWAELERLRGHQAVAPLPAYDVVSASERLMADLRSNCRPLEALSLVWAYYIDDLGKERLARLLNKAPRTVYERVDKALPEVERLLEYTARKRRLSRECRGGWQDSPMTDMPFYTPAVEPSVSGDVSDDGLLATVRVGDSSEQAKPVADMDGGATPTNQYQTIHHIWGNQVVVINDHLDDSLTQSAADHQPAARGSSHQSSNTTDRFYGALTALFITTIAWSALVMPRLSTISMLMICACRTVLLARQTVKQRRAPRTEQFWWYVCAMGPWLFLAGLAVSVAVRLPHVLMTAVYTEERLSLMLQVVCIGSGMLLVGMVDILLWIDRAAPQWGPWRQFRSHATWIAEQRWEAMSLLWLAVIVLAMVCMMSSAI